MIDGKRCLAVAPARGGSKGLPRKNLRLLGDRPLVAWTQVEAAKSAYLDRCILSTDDPEIMAVGRQWGMDVPFQRPADLATDTARAEDVMVHALETLNEAYDYILMLHTTVPFRRAEDIDGALSLVHETDAPCGVSVSLQGKPPQWMFSRNPESGHMDPLFGWENLWKRRQQLAPAYLPTGAVFVARVDYFLAHRSFYGEGMVGYVMPAERSIDIDSESDFNRAQTKLHEDTQSIRHPTE